MVYRMKSEVNEMKYEGRIDDDDKFLGSMKAVGSKKEEERKKNLWMIALIWLWSYSQTNSFFHLTLVFFGNIGTWFRAKNCWAHMCEQIQHTRWQNEIIIGCWEFYGNEIKSGMTKWHSESTVVAWQAIYVTHYVNHIWKWQDKSNNGLRRNCDSFEGLLAFCVAEGYQ